ncbi:MAG: hypothetical protein RTS72_00025 [Candidatus Thorarchaeota archaeon]
MKNTNPEATDIAVAIAMVAVLGPAYIQPQYSDISWIIVSMMWQIWIGSTIIPFFHPWVLIPTLPFTFMRLIVAFMFYRLYRNKTTVKRVMVIVLVSAIQPILLYDIPVLLFALQGPFSYNIPFIIPIPILALIALLIVRTYPPPKREVDWVEKSERAW